MSSHRVILHLDMDAFFASVEQLIHPELRGKPVIVGGHLDEMGRLVLTRGVVSTASYEARKYGVGSGMPLFAAKKLCPYGIFVPVDFKSYRKYSEKVFLLMEETCPIVERRSLDEGYGDLTGTKLVYDSTEEAAKKLQKKIFEETGLTCSIGVATSKTVAKIASDYKKPNGITVVEAGKEAEFLRLLPIAKMGGIGPVTERKLLELGVKTLGELVAIGQEKLEEKLGKVHGKALFERSQGIDESPVETASDPKSISVEETFIEDIWKLEEGEGQIRGMCHQVGKKMREEGYKARRVDVKMRFTNFKTITRQVTLKEVTNGDGVITKAALELLQRNWGKPVRLLGVGVSELSRATQGQALGTSEALDNVLDNLQGKHGESVVKRGLR